MLQKRNSAAGLVLLLIASLLTVLSPGRAVADTGIAWSTSVDSTRKLTSPTGSVTIPCEYSLAGGRDLVTYDATGQVIRRIPYAQVIDGVENCINDPVVDKNDVLYGVPFGKRRYSGTGYAYGVNLLAYKGSTLLWKYPVNLTNGDKRVAVGANGNVYTRVHTGDGDHLVGLVPTLSAGATQPRKVLDVKLPFGDSATYKMSAYRDGLILHTGSAPNMKTHFFSYGGAYLGESPVHPMDEVFNAEGKLFIPSVVNYQYNYGNSYYADANVSMFEPRKGTIWTRSVVTPGAHAWDVRLSALQNGGVVAAVTESRMVAGVPVTPTEWVHRLVTLDYNGRQIQSIALPAEDSAGNKFTPGAFWAIADGTGKVAVLQSNRDSIVIDVYDAMTGKQSYHTSLPGHTLYYTGSPALAKDTLLFSADCNGCNPSSQMLAVRISGIGMDYPRSAVLSRTARPKTGYLALGDSFSSGEGVEPFSTGTATPGLNTCHRSTLAYPRLIAGTSTKIPPLASRGFRACSGAVTEDITDATQWNEGTQLDLWPDTSTKVVTLTIGGNDIGFSSFGEACVKSTCKVGSDAYKDAVNKISNDLPGKLETTYKRILKYAPNAKIYVLGYPHVIANKTTSDGLDARCPYMWDILDGWADAWAARAVVTKLDLQISNVIKKVRAQSSGNLRLRYVPADGATSPFKGHEICGSGTSWFQNINQAATDSTYVFHPNKSGQEQGYKVIAQKAINAG